MFNRINRSLLSAIVALVTLPGLASAAVIDVLWLGGSTNYNTGIETLVDKAASEGTNTWNLTFLKEGDAAPAFGSFDVFVIGSTTGVGADYDTGYASGRDGLNYNVLDGFFGLGVDAQRVIDNSAAITDARGERTFLSGQDADWHYLNNLQAGPFDGPEGS